MTAPSPSARVLTEAEQGTLIRAAVEMPGNIGPLLRAVATLIAAAEQAATERGRAEEREAVIFRLMRAEEETGKIEHDGTLQGAYSQGLRDAQIIARGDA